MYSVVMGACAQGKQAERALDLLEDMEADEECRGNSFAWNNAMVACNKASQPHAALSLYDRMRNGACALSDHSVAAALVACRATADTTADWQRAQAVFDGSHSTSAMCFNALLDVLAEAAQWTLLLTYFDEMRKAGT